MPIQSHAALRLSIARTLAQNHSDKENLFNQQYCFGYASTWIEAHLRGERELFYNYFNHIQNQESQRAFYQRLVKHQQIIFPEHRVQNILKTTDYAEVIAQAGSFSGCYQSHDLKKLCEILQTMQASLLEPSGWILRCRDHASVLSFHQNMVWLCDVNHPHAPLIFSGVTEKGRSDLVHQLMILMKDSDCEPSSIHRIITFEWFVPGKYFSSMRALLNDCLSSSPFLMLQKITSEKLWNKEGAGRKWIRRAIFSADHDLLSRILSVDAEFTRQILADHSCLSEAIMTGDLTTCEILLNHGANWRSLDPQGRTVLHRAILHFEPEIVDLLLGCEGIFELSYYKGLSPIEYASHIIPKGSWQTLRHEKILNTLQVKQRIKTHSPWLLRGYLSDTKETDKTCMKQILSDQEKEDENLSRRFV